MKLIDLTGRRFRFLLVISESHKKHGKTFWKCLCDCGKIKSIASDHLLRKIQRVKSCGCMKGALRVETIGSHGKSNTPEWVAWKSAKTRCENQKAQSWKLYGAKGVAMCREWSESFLAFFRYMGERPSSKHSLDRFPNPSGNYEPGNCRWATMKEQSENKRNIEKVNYRGVVDTTFGWSKKLGFKSNVVLARKQKGWTLEGVMYPYKLDRHSCKRFRQLEEQKARL